MRDAFLAFLFKSCLAKRQEARRFIKKLCSTGPALQKGKGLGEGIMARGPCKQGPWAVAGPAEGLCGKPCKRQSPAEGQIRFLCWLDLPCSRLPIDLKFMALAMQKPATGLKSIWKQWLASRFSKSSGEAQGWGPLNAHKKSWWWWWWYLKVCPHPVWKQGDSHFNAWWKAFSKFGSHLHQFLGPAPLSFASISAMWRQPHHELGLGFIKLAFQTFVHFFLFYPWFCILTILRHYTELLCEHIGMACHFRDSSTGEIFIWPWYYMLVNYPAVWTWYFINFLMKKIELVHAHICDPDIFMLPEVTYYALGWDMNHNWEQITEHVFHSLVRRFNRGASNLTV